MKLLTLLTLQLLLLIATPCYGQKQLAWPANPQLGGFPPGHPGIPVLIDNESRNPDNWDAANLKPGDPVLLELVDKPAEAYIRLFPRITLIEGACVTLEARIVKVDTENIVAEYQVMTSRNTDNVRIVTLTTTCSYEQIQAPPYVVGLMPATADPKELRRNQMLERDASLPRIRIDTFDQSTIRTWRLEKEINK